MAVSILLEQPCNKSDSPIKLLTACANFVPTTWDKQCEDNLLKTSEQLNFVCRFIKTCLLHPVYTRANDSGFVANTECFDIGFVLPFTLRNMNPIQNYHR